MLALAASTATLNAQLLVTEIHSDGLWDFWELTNVGAASVDLSGFKWDDDSRNPSDAAAVTIPNGTMIAAGESIVFAGVAVGNPTTFRTAWNIPNTVQVIVGGPNFGGGDGVAFFNPSNVEQFFLSYAAYNATTGVGFIRSTGVNSSGGHAGLSAGGTAVQAMIWDTGSTTSPRYTFATGLNFGTFAAGTSTTIFGSPGYSGFGAAPPSATLSVSATATTFAESAASPASTGTVTRSVATASDLVVNHSSSDATEATVPATVTILANETSANFAITAIDDTFPDGTKTATITASATGATPGTVILTVTDDGDVPDNSFMLTEMQSDQSPGSPAGSEDYWELTNISAVARDIGGYSWHDSGRSGSAAAAYKLPAGTMIAPGESVVFTVMPVADFRTWWNLAPSVQVFQSTGAPGTGKGDGISFFDAGQNELFFFSYAVAGFTREDGSPAIGENPLDPNDVLDPAHAGIAAGGSDAWQAVVWVPSSGTSSPRYAAATGSNHGSFTAAVGTDTGSPGITVGVPSVSIASASISEGNSGTSTLVLNVTRSEISSAFTVDYTVTGGTADGADYSLASGTLTFTTGGPASLPINITVNGDTTSEPDETVIVTLSNVVNTTGTTILNNAVGTGTILTDDIISPQITAQPASTTITSGGVATLTLTATGSPAPTIQWYQGTSGNISNPVGTNSNILTTSALTANTSYWARATNSGSSVDSDTVTVTVVAGVVGVDLSTYVRTGRYGLPEWRRTPLPPGTAAHNLLCDEASAVTYNWDTDTLFISCDGGRSITQVSKTGQLIDTMSLDLLAGAPQGTAFYDPEGITYIGGGQFVMSEERDRQLVKFTYAAGTTLTRANSQTVDLGTFDDNTGTEGLSWDPQTNGFIVLKEKTPIGVFQTNVDFAAGTATNGSPSTANSTNLFDTTLLGLTDVADVFTFSNIPSMTGQPQAGNLLIVGQEDARILNVTRTGVIQSLLNITADPGDLISSSNMQHEGITMDRAGNIYVVNENGGGSIEFPELWVYSVSTAANAAPTGIALNNAVTSLQENSSTASTVKVADIAVTDDGLGTNTLALTGADAFSFEITGSALFIKAGVALDFETKPSYSITVTVDDTTLGATPDATVNYTLTVTDQVVEIAAAPALLITEVAPWSSGNSPGVAADWFEVTNVSANPVTVTGWKVDDSSNSFAAAIALSGITTIAPGESVIFLESTPATQPVIVNNFKTTWFGANPPAGLQVGTYTGTGIGLGTGGDALNLFNAVGALQANVTFGVSDAASPYQTFDNTAARNSAAISQLSVLGVNGAFVAANSPTEIGSPGYSAPAVLRITEVAPWSSGNSPVAADWFEVTNTGARAADITGWLVDDNSESAAAAGPITGVTSIAPGESAIFIDSANLETARTNFLNNWFGANPPANLQIGTYTGAGGLGTGGDAVNLYDTASSTRVRQVNLAFGASPGVAPYTTFDNAAGLNVATATTFSAVGTNGAFIAANSPNEIGSPGTIVDFRLQLLHLADAEAGLLASQTAPNLAALVDAFDGTYPNTLIVAGGDNFIPGPFISAGTDPAVAATHTRGNNPAAADIEIHNRLGVEASTIGNHEFDLGTNAFSDAILDTTFPYLSANLNFAGDSGISARYQETVGVGGLEEASTLAQKIVPSAVVTKNGQKIGLVGATTQIVESISSTGGVEVKGFAGDGSEVDDMVLLASQIQPVIDELKAQGVNKIILMAHLQQIANEQTLAPLLTDVDIILAAGSNTRLGDGTDVPVAFVGHAANFAGNYPIYTAGADGKPTVIVNTDNEFTYLGRLVADFDANGNLIVPNLAASTSVNGAYAATAANVAAAWGVSEANLAATAFAPGTKGAGVKQITDAVQGVINAKDGDVRGFTNVYLEGERNFVRNQETNLGNISADSMITVGETALPANKFVASLKNGGGIRAQIGAVDVVSGAKLPPLANPGAGKPSGGISLLDIENSMRFNNGLMLCDATPAGLKAILEHGVALLGNQGRFPQIGGIRFAFDPALAAGSRVRSIVTIDQNENITGRVVEGGVVVPEAPPVITLVTLNFLAQGGDSYPFKANADNFRYLLNDGTLSAPIDESLNFTAVGVVPANLLGEQAALSSHLTAFHATPATAYALADTAPALDTRIQSLAARADAVALGPVTLNVWLADNGFANGNGDSDNDTLIDLLEFAFGLNPNVGDNGPNITDVINGILVSRGTPTIYSAPTANGQDFRVVFIRRKNPGALGLTYTPQFSSDMTDWVDSLTVPTVIAGDSEVEAVSVRYPFFVNGKKAKFFRVGVSQY